VFRVVVPTKYEYVGLGTPFAKSVYLILDSKEERVGLG